MNPQIEANTERLYKLISLIIQAFHFLPTEKEVKITSFQEKIGACHKAFFKIPLAVDYAVELLKNMTTCVVLLSKK